ncbi:hypothetical protein C482_10082 [Natrialba chahannaoensis JCM 10990]|uniref:Uncharacterized protein n=1 Tax=Natrialba chahannaoensis JCM 10990 TaxID=1227492 RepID=M0ANB5_9EURY|nr:hypothetical protein [Natrialba chahannaoensis]ELY99826.1 hypothetical protein C482_10082 [Natrialba chahannaoensis JCM 10990]
MAQDDADVVRNEHNPLEQPAQGSYPETPAATAEPSPATIVATGDPDGSDRTLTIIGRGVPTIFEITVEGRIEGCDAATTTDTSVLSGSTVEGTIEDGTVEFEFTGDLTDVTFVDRGITGLSPSAAPHVHVDYSTS